MKDDPRYQKQMYANAVRVLDHLRMQVALVAPLGPDQLDIVIMISRKSGIPVHLYDGEGQSYDRS